MNHGWLREARAREKLTRAQLAARAKTTPRVIYMLEDDDSAVTHPKIARRIVRVLGADVEAWKTIVPHKYHNRPPVFKAAEPQQAEKQPKPGFEGNPVEIVDLNGNVLGRFASQRAASMYVGRSATYIHTGLLTGEVQITCDHVEYRVRPAAQ